VVNAAHAIAEKIQAGQYDRGNIKAITRIVEDNIEIEIANDGPEISGADIGRIFEPYFTTKEPGKGTGLGLSLVKRIIEKDHGGTIRVSSTTKATSFTLVLPQNRPENEQR
jgi:signal transduction histidine kinase